MESAERPWGSYTVLSDEEDHKVKRIEVHPGRRLSYQRHAQRSEHWFVISGTGRFILDDAVTALAAGDAVDIPAGCAHRIENPDESEPLVIIEVQHGTYFGEDDIERLQDDYGRA
jgi:mannose-6-phosphate isomerase